MTKLYILTEKGERQSYDIPGDAVHIGRAPENDIQIKDKFASRKHFKLERKGNKYFIQDLKSKNGTFVDGKQIGSNGAYEVQEGMTIVAGMSVICLGEGSSDDVFAFLDSFGPVKDFSEAGRIILKDRVMTRKKNKELIEKVSEVLLGPSDITETSEKMLGYIFDLFKRIDRGAIVFFDQKRGIISGVISRSKEGVEKTGTKYNEKVVLQAVKTGKPIMLSDTHDRNDDDPAATLRMLKVKSMMCVPLIASSKPVGAIYVDSLTEPFGFRKDDLSLFTALSSRLAMALETASKKSKKNKP